MGSNKYWGNSNEDMLYVKNHYSEVNTRELLIQALDDIFQNINQKPVLLCIGTSRHLLDCFGPMVGTMIMEQTSRMVVYGTLDEPIHARNIGRQIKMIKERHPYTLQIAIDASLGKPDDIGIIKMRDGALIPGKALGKPLPPAGDISITGIVGSKIFRRDIGIIEGSMADVYHMARVISSAVIEWLARQEKY